MTSYQQPEDRPRGKLPEPARRPRRRLLAWAALTAACLAGVGALMLAGPRLANANTRDTAQDPVIDVTTAGGNGQTTTTRSSFGEPLRVLVYDDSGHPSMGTAVTFRVVTGYAGLTGTAAFPDGAQSADVVTGADGTAVSPALTAGADVGYLDVVASVPGGNSAATFVLSVDYSPAAHINLVSGDAQSAQAGTGFAHPFVVQVLDAHGYPVRDAEKVTFQVQPAGPDPGLATFPDSQTTATEGIGADGYATSPALTAGSRAGTIQVIASVPESPNAPEAVFTGTVLPQAATTMEVSGGNYQFGSADSLFPAPLQVRVLDQAGHPIPSPQAHAIVTGPAAVSGKTSLDVTGDPDGVISMPLAAADDSGPVKVTVTAGTATVTLYEYVVPGRGAVTITTRGGGQQTDPGQPFPARLAVLVHDGDSRVIPDFPVTFSVDGPAAFADGSKSATVTSSATDVTSAPPLHATSAQGPVAVTVTIAGSDAIAVFRLEVGHANGLIIVGGNRQTALQSVVGRPLIPFPAPLTVQAIQSNGQPANGLKVTYTVHGAAFFQVNKLVSATIDELTGTDGQISAILYTRYDMNGTVTVTPSAPGFGSVTFTEAVVSR